MLALDEFIMLALRDRDWHADLSQIVHRTIGSRFHHEADRFGECLELVRVNGETGPFYVFAHVWQVCEYKSNGKLTAEKGNADITLTISSPNYK